MYVKIATEIGWGYRRKGAKRTKIKMIDVFKQFMPKSIRVIMEEFIIYQLMLRVNYRVGVMC